MEIANAFLPSDRQGSVYLLTTDTGVLDDLLISSLSAYLNHLEEQRPRSENLTQLAKK